MKTNKLYNLALALVLTVSFASCGSDNKSGGAAPLTANTSITGEAATVGTNATVDQLITSVSTGKFAMQSRSNFVYNFKKIDDYTGSETCWFGDYKGDFDQVYGVRVLDYSGNIQRDLDINRMGCTVHVTFTEDEMFGNNLSQLATNTAQFIRDAKAVHSSYSPSLMKGVNGYFHNYIESTVDCRGDNMCESVKSSDSKIWRFERNGQWFQIDLNRSLIENPTRVF